MFASKQIFYVFLGLCISTQLLVASTSSSQALEKVEVELSLQNVTMVQVFQAIESKTEFTFSYTGKVAKDLSKVTIDIRADLKTVLTRLAEKSRYNFRRINNRIYVVPRSAKKEIEITEELVDKNLSGKVMDADTGEPLAGATVQVKGTLIGTITDLEGNFTLSVPDDAGVLIVSYIGFRSLEIQVGNQAYFEVSMEADIAALNEIVVVGYGQQEAKDVTGSVKELEPKDFNGGIVNSPGQLLQGKVAGVNIVSGTGEPGSAIDINIRGINSIGSGSNPLFVIDGVPIDAAEANATSFGGISPTRPKSPLNFLNPQDIASITILKDASATAIYGTRGANGVVIIETKKGSTNTEGTVSYNGYVGVSSLTGKIDVLNAEAYRRETARLSEILGRDPDVFIEDPNVDTDWQDEILSTAATYNHSVSFAGGSANTNYNFSLGYLDQEGILDNTSQERVTGRINIGTSAIGGRLKLQLNAAAANITDESQATNGGALSNIISSALRANPTASPRDANGNFNAKAGAADNPSAFFDLYRDLTLSKTLLANLSATFTIIEGLDYRVNLGYENTDADRRVRVFPNADSGGDIEEGGVSVTANEAENSLIENYLTYSRSVNQLNYEVLLGHSFQRFIRRGQFVRRTDFSTTEIDPIDNIEVAENTESVGSSLNERKLQSFFGRVNLDLEDKYLLTASIRADGSSVFGANNRYGYFPSVAFGWRLSEEAFLLNSGIFDNLKIRVGWGQTGNQAVPVKVTQASFVSSEDRGYVFEGRNLVNGIGVARTANPDLKWEVTTQTNIGLDWSILGGRVFGAVDYFYKNTTDIFLEVAASAPAVVNSIFVNADTEIINEGVELELSSRVVSKQNLKLNIGGNIAFLENTVEGLANDIRVGGVSALGASGETVAIYRSGLPASSFYLPVFSGFNESGFEILSDEPQVVGDALPDVIYGFNINAQYKNFDFDMGFNGVSGVSIFNNTARLFSNASSLGQNGNNVISSYFDPAESPERAIVTSSRYIEDGDYLRLNNATLAYNFDASSIDWLSRLRLYVTGQNLFVISDYSGYDPEVNTNGGNAYGIDRTAYPRARTFLVGVDVTF